LIIIGKSKCIKMQDEISTNKFHNQDMLLPKIWSRAQNSFGFYPALQYIQGEREKNIGKKVIKLLILEKYEGEKKSAQGSS
jgi:hypothetical protein